MKIVFRSAMLLCVGLLVMLARPDGAFGQGAATAEPTDFEIQAVTPAGTAAPVSLRSLADARGFLVGAAVNVPVLGFDTAYQTTLAGEYNLVVPENVMKFDATEPLQGTYTYKAGDALVKFAEAHDMKVRGHNLVWHNQLPDWLTIGTFTKDQLLKILHDHITALVSHFKGHVYAWDVVNEGIGDDYQLRNTLWYQTIGPDYIKDAFEWAHEADPNAVLFYNDYGGEDMGPKSDAIYTLVKDLVAQGVPINGVGLQMHVSTQYAPTASNLARNMARLNDLGLQVQITEMDVDVHKGPGSADAKFAAQASIYGYVLTTCLQAKNCTALLTWGFTDGYSWIKDASQNPDGALPFDKTYSPKPAYQSLIAALQNTK
jgi:endo-1,4-beta-xylanase